jgi:branched-chain amino acid aminotransferase
LSSETGPVRTDSADRNASAGLRLQRPEVVWYRGALTPWDEATLHVGSEAAVRGLNVFEGLKAYWQPDDRLAFVLLRRHFDRLHRSARLLHIPWEATYEEFEHAVFEISRALRERENDLYVRATLFVIEGHYGSGTVSDLVLTAYQQPVASPEPISVGVSTWRRADDVMMPPRIKTGTNYQVARLARIEGRDRGYADMLLLNSAGRVAESTGACLLLVRDGTLMTPPTWEGALESITLDALFELCASLGVAAERRPIDRTELFIADELGLTGSLAEVTPIVSVDERRLPAQRPVLDALQAAYRAAVTGRAAHPAVELTSIPD